TQSLGDPGTTDFWVAQFLLAVDRWRAKNPSDRLQAVFLFDEADQYLPAVGKPATQGPMAGLSKQDRRGGGGLVLATLQHGGMVGRASANRGRDLFRRNPDDLFPPTGVPRCL